MAMRKAWSDIPIPARKSDYAYKHLRLLADPEQFSGLSGQVVQITRRLNGRETLNSANDIAASWGVIRILKIRWRCPHCEADHEFYIPESWIEEGKAVFVERAEKNVSGD